MAQDKMLYLVICGHRDGEYLPEREVCDLDRATTIKDIRDGQFENVIRVLECNPVEAICRDVTEDIFREVGDDETPVCSSIDFIRDRNRDYRKVVA